MPRFVDHFRDVQQRLRGNAAAIDADAAGIGFGIDERDAEAEIGGEKRGRVPPGTAADDNELCGNHMQRQCELFNDCSSRRDERRGDREGGMYESDFVPFVSSVTS